MKSVWLFGSSYIIPNTDNVVLGGTAQKGDWNRVNSLEDTKQIMEKITQVFPALETAPIVSELKSSCMSGLIWMFPFC
jgi:D-amino-acid oxidase